MEEYIQQAIQERRSIREFTEQAVAPELLYKIITAGIWAPSGLNNQPWRFVTIQEKAIATSLPA